jgi:hypothetical protein
VHTYKVLLQKFMQTKDVGEKTPICPRCLSLLIMDSNKCPQCGLLVGDEILFIEDFISPPNNE